MIEDVPADDLREPCAQLSLVISAELIERLVCLKHALLNDVRSADFGLPIAAHALPYD